MYVKLDELNGEIKSGETRIKFTEDNVWNDLYVPYIYYEMASKYNQHKLVGNLFNKLSPFNCKMSGSKFKRRFA